MTTNTVRMLSVCTALLVAPAVGAARQATPPATPQQHQHPAAPADKGQQPSAEMAAKCQAMMANGEKMMAEMKAADQRLETLVAAMNAASGQQKVDATAATVAELIVQRKAMHQHMMHMMHAAMSHMAEHMQAGAQSIAACPMLRDHGAGKR